MRSASLAVAAHGYEITVVAPHGPAAPVEELDGALRVHRFRYAVPASAQRVQWSAVRSDWVAQATLPAYVAAFALAARRAASRSELIHAHWIPSALVARAASVGRKRLPFVVSVWGSDLGLLRRPRLGPRLLVALRQAEAVTAVSDAMSRELSAAGVDEDRVHVVPSAIERPRLPDTPVAETRRRLGLPEQGPIVLFLGRLSFEKGPDVLVNAIERLDAATRPLAIIAGDGPDRVALIERVGARGLELGVRFPGYIRHDEIGSWLHAADLLVLPSRSEGLPHAALEAMSVGRPVVASAVGGLPHLIRHGENGWLVAPENPEALAAALTTLSADATLRERLGEAARLDADRDHVGYARVGRELARIYAAALSRRR